ncbi:MAG: hypothetical protein ACJ8I9_09475 [Chthoniobacterales bacterium]|jgi:hypothetical protein
MHKPTTYTSVIALCAITALTVILPNSYADSFGPRTVAIDERGAEPVAAKLIGPIIVPPAPQPKEQPVPIVTPYTTPFIIKPTN